MSTKRKITLVIADDHPIFRKGLRMILEQNKDLTVLDEAEKGNDACELIRTMKPDVAILDVDMPGMSGVEVVQTLKKEKSKTAFVFLTMFKEKDLFDEAMELDVRGYVLKDNALSEISNCVRAVAQGEVYISPTLSSFVVQHSATIKQFKKKHPAIDHLTPTEKNILRSVAEHKTSKEIASELNISVRTVEHHRAHIAAKLKLKGSQAVLKFAVENRKLL